MFTRCLHPTAQIFLPKRLVFNFDSGMEGGSYRLVSLQSGVFFARYKKSMFLTLPNGEIVEHPYIEEEVITLVPPIRKGSRKRVKKMI